ncbi:MAG: prohibitin family protein [Spirochaetia bacterium]|nr:prohibitin family protein [Spirochaetia bacterium]
MNNELEMEWSKLKKAGLMKYLLIPIVVVFVYLLNPFVTVPAGHRGVVLNFGAVSDKIMGEGLHLRIPIMQSVIKMDVQLQKSNTKADAATKDLQNTKFAIVINYHVSPDKVNWVYQKIGAQYEDRIIDPNVEEAVKAISAKYTAEQLITKRQAVSEEIMASLKAKLIVYNIVVDNFSIVDFEFSAQFAEAIEQKQAAEQMALKAERDLTRITTEAKQKVEGARAEAMSLRLKRMEVTTQLLELKKIEAEMKAIEKWDGKLPTYTGGGAMPFLNLNNKNK